MEEDQDTADEDVKEADIIEPAEPNLSKSLDTKATLASAIIAADSVLVAGQSFFMFQMAPDKPAWIAYIAGACVVALLLAVLLAIFSINAVTNYYADGRDEYTKKEARGNKPKQTSTRSGQASWMLNASLLITYVSVLAFAVLSAIVIFSGEPAGETDPPAGQEDGEPRVDESDNGEQGSDPAGQDQQQAPEYMKETLFYDCDVTYSGDGNTQAKMTCTRDVIKTEPDQSDP